MRKALVVGIDAYRDLSPLYGCERDARAMSELLGRNEDGSVNFGSNVLLGTEDTEVVTRARLRDSIEQLFSGDGEVALLHFSGHGHVEAAGGYLCAGDTRSGSDGVPLAEVMTFANTSRFRNRIIFLDSCHSGVAGGPAAAAGRRRDRRGRDRSDRLDGGAVRAWSRTARACSPGWCSTPCAARRRTSSAT